MSRKMTVHVRYNSWYISLPFSAKQILRCLYNDFYFQYNVVLHIQSI